MTLLSGNTHHATITRAQRDRLSCPDNTRFKGCSRRVKNKACFPREAGLASPWIYCQLPTLRVNHVIFSRIAEDVGDRTRYEIQRSIDHIVEGLTHRMEQKPEPPIGIIVHGRSGSRV
jgi:hypothetical protein